MRVLIVRLTSFGDIVHSFPLASDIKSHFPHATIDWLVDSMYEDLVRLNANVDRVYSIPWRALGVRASIGKLRSLSFPDYDVLLDIHGLYKSAICAHFVNATQKVTHQQAEWGSGIVFDRKVRVERKAHNLIDATRLFGSVLWGYELAPRYDFGIREVADSAPLDAPYVFFIPNHSKGYTAKRWPVAHWRELVDRALAASHNVAMFYFHDEEKAFIDGIAKGKGDGITLIKAPNTKELARWLYHAKAVVGLDTGALHLAAALPSKAKVVGLISGGGAHRLRDDALGGRLYLSDRTLFCYPCNRKICKNPNDHGEVSCLATLEPEIVWQKLSVSD